MTKVYAIGSLFVALLLLASPVSAGAISVDAGWYGFCFGLTGSPATAGCQNSGIGTTGNPFTFTAAGPVLFNITDAFQTGDTFQVNIDSGAIVFTTPTVAAGMDPQTSDPNVAFASSIYSHSSTALGAGAHTVNVFAAASPFGAGGAYLEVVSGGPAVPEPATTVFVGGGLAVAMLLGRRRQSSMR